MRMKKMSQKMSRALALILSVLLMISAMACGQEQNEPENEGEENSQQESEDGEAGELDTTPITLTWGFRDVNIREAGILSEKSEIWKYVEEKFGITIEIVAYDYEKYNVLAAGSDLPDIVSTIAGGTPIQDIIDSGQLLPLDDLLDSYGQDITRNISTAIERVNEPYGVTYLLPSGVEGPRDVPLSNGYFGAFQGRYDVFKAIGSPAIDGWDSLLEVAKQMQDYERARTGRDDIYAFSMYFANSAGTLIPMFAMGWEGMACGVEYNLQTYETRNMYLDPDSARWEQYELYNKMYRMGIFDPDSLIMNATEYQDKIMNGSTLFSQTWNMSVNEGVGVPGYEEYAGLFNLPGSVDFIAFLCSRISPLGYVNDSARAISTNCEYPERAMQLLNWLDSTEGARMFYNGMEGESWEYVDGVPQYTEAVYEAADAGTLDDYWKDKRLSSAGSNLMNSGPNAIITDDGYPADLASSAEYIIYTAPDEGKAFAADFGCEYPGQVYKKWIDEGSVATDVYSEEYAETIANVKNVVLTSELQNIYTAVTDLVASSMNEIIMAESEEAFEQVKTDLIEQFKELGLEDVQEEVDRQLSEVE